MNNPAKHTCIFPMHHLARLMDQHGTQGTAIRSFLASELTQRLNRHIRVTPTFHECFNFITDVMMDRIVLDPKTSKLLSALLPNATGSITPVSPEKLHRQIFTCLSPEQVGALHSLERSKAFVGHCKVAEDTIASYIMFHLYEAYPDTFKYECVLDPAFRESAYAVFLDLAKTWEQR